MKPFRFYVRLLLEALYKLPLYTDMTGSQYVTLWRGVNLNVVTAYFNVKGQTIVWWPFSSCTLDIEGQYSEGGHF